MLTAYIIEELQHEGFILLVGDFTAHIGKLVGSRSFCKINKQGYQLWNMLEKFDFVFINSEHSASGPIEMFYACSGAVKMTVDHIFAPSGFMSLVENCSVSGLFIQSFLPPSCFLWSAI